MTVSRSEKAARDCAPCPGLLAAGLAVLLLAGCGAAGPGGSGAPPGPQPGYGDYQATADGLHATWDVIPFTSPASLPISGGAIFNGVLGLRIGTAAGERRMNGALALTVQFSTSSLTGTAGAFSDQKGATLTGGLAITNGVIDRAANPALGYTFSANMDGTISGPGDSFTITSDLSGDFRGAGHGAVAGAVAGSAVSGSGTGYLFGSFIAAR